MGNTLRSATKGGCVNRALCVGVTLVIGIVASNALASVILDPTAFASGTDVSTSFDGVVLSNVEATSNAINTTVISPLRQISTSTAPVYAASNTFSRFSFPALWSSGPCCAQNAALRVDFIDFAGDVTVQFLPDDMDTGLLAIFGPSGEVLADLVAESASPFTLSYTTTGTPISYVLASYSDTGFLGSIQFSSVVPEPTTLALLGLGLTGLGFSRRKQ